MSRFNDLYYGTPTDAIAQLEEQNADNPELRGALINCLSRIARLEHQVAELQAPKKTPKKGARQ
jgi:hypothetical protein